MDLKKLYCTKHWLEYSSFSFNVENYVLLTNSLIVLQNENHFKAVFVWGVIYGLDADYYIVFGYKADAIKDRTFFYSDDYQNWKLLPVPQQEHLVLSELCKRPFQGDPGLVIEVVDDAPIEELFPNHDSEKETVLLEENDILASEKTSNDIRFDTNAEEEGIEIETKTSSQASQLQSVRATEPQQITSGSLKEEDRLAAVVRIITEETAIVPRGGIFKQTDGTNVHSRAFEGLSLEDVDELCNFQHYRIPQQDWNTNLMAHENYNYAIDFLDTIDKDFPSDTWSGQLMEGDRVIVIRNLIWPGFTFFHHIQTPEHGFIYVGYGQRNLDIPFMTQVGEKPEMVEKESDVINEPSRLVLASQIPLIEVDKRTSQDKRESVDTTEQIPVLSEVDSEIKTSA